MTGSFSGAVTTTIPGVAFSANLTAELDTAAGRVRVTGTDVNLTIAGLSLHADFTLEATGEQVKLTVANTAARPRCSSSARSSTSRTPPAC